MTILEVTLDIYAAKIHFFHCALKELREMSIDYIGDDTTLEHLDDAVGCGTSEMIWVSDDLDIGSLEFTSTLVHEVVHCVDYLMLELNLEGTEVRAYTSGYIFSKILSSLKTPLYKE